MRLIDADALIDRVTRMWENRQLTNTKYKSFTEILTAQPTADVVERKKGEWVWMGEKGDSRFMCSVCKSKENVPTIMGKPEVWWFCPNCGADMRKEIEWT